MRKCKQCGGCGLVYDPRGDEDVECPECCGVGEDSSIPPEHLCAITGELFDGAPCSCPNCTALAADSDIMDFLACGGPEMVVDAAAKDIASVPTADELTHWATIRRPS